MAWNKQMEEMVGSWTDMQRRMWDNWLVSVKRFGENGAGAGMEPGGDVEQEYHKNLKAWEQSVNQALEAQNAWARKWSEQGGQEQQMPAAASEWNAKIQEMMKGWTDSQQQLWTAWFESIRTMDPSKATSQWENESKQVMEAWQQAAERAQETLADWAKSAQAAQAQGEGPGPAPRKPQAGGGGSKTGNPRSSSS